MRQKYNILRLSTLTDGEGGHINRMYSMHSKSQILRQKPKKRRKNLTTTAMRK
jgi:hypothetical protein